MRSSSILDSVPQPAPRPTRRRWGFVVVFAVALLTAWATVKRCGGGAVKERAIEHGMVLLVEALAADDAASSEAAERHFVEAASVAILDRYPAFLIHANREIGEALRSGTSDPLLAAIVAQDWADARAAVAVSGEGGERGERRRSYWERLVRDLERHSATRTR